MAIFKKKLCSITLLLLVTFLPWNATAFNPGDHHWAKSANPLSNNSIEDLLALSLTAITSGQFDQAIETLDKILSIAPNFKLAHLVKGDLLMARAQRFQDFGSSAPNSEDVNGLRDEARKRLERYLAQDLSKQIPSDIWKLNNEVSHVLVVDADQSRLFVYKNENEYW